MSMPTCVTMPNGVIAMFPDWKTAERAYHDAYPNANASRGPRVGTITSTRTMEYIDLHGAPWVVTLTSTGIGTTEAASAVSPAYQPTGASPLASDSLESNVVKIDDYAKVHARDSLDAKNLKHYPQSPFKDSNDDEWSVEWITKKNVGALGYFAFQANTAVGPAVNKTALKAMVEKFLTRSETEKSTTSSYAITSLTYAIDPTRSMDPPPGIPDESAGTHWGNVVIFTGGFALLSCLAYFAWTNLGAE